MYVYFHMCACVCEHVCIYICMNICVYASLLCFVRLLGCMCPVISNTPLLPLFLFAFLFFLK